MNVPPAMLGPVALTAVVDSALLRSKIRPSETPFLVLNLYSRRNWMSRTQLAFNSGDLAFQEIITSRPNVNSATRVVSRNAVWPVTATFPSTPLIRQVELGHRTQDGSQERLCER